MNKLSIPVHSKLLKLRGILNHVNHASYTYSRLNKDIPISTIDSDKRAEEIIEAYETILDDLRKSITE